MGTEIASTDTRTLADCEAVIERGLTTFFDVGSALFDIREGKLYKDEGYTTFERYCNRRWDFSSTRAYQLIAATEVSAELSTKVDIPPERETHVRPLVPLPEDCRAEVWKRVIDTAPTDANGNPRPTKSHVEQTVAAWKEEQQESEPEATSEPIDDVIDVESSPIDSDGEVEDYEDEHSGDPVNCQTCNRLVVPDEDGDCPTCLEPLVARPECSVDDDSPEQTADDLFLESIEGAIRSQFEGRYVIAAARLETMVEKLRSEI